MREDFGRNRPYRRNPRNRKGDHLVFGLTLSVIGVLMLLRMTGMIHFDLHQIWPLMLVLAGLLMGLRSRFRRNAWWILILIGTAHMIPRFEINGIPSNRLVWPAALIVGGIAVALRPAACRRHRYHGPHLNTVTNNENEINIDITFGGRKEIVTSKEFTGGRLQATFSGCELNLMQADNPAAPVTLDLKVAFGGVEIIVPSHWDLQNEISPSFGSVEDHRTIHTPPSSGERRLLVLRGSVSFGSVEIKSY